MAFPQMHGFDKVEYLKIISMHDDPHHYGHQADLLNYIKQSTFSHKERFWLLVIITLQKNYTNHNFSPNEHGYVMVKLPGLIVSY